MLTLFFGDSAVTDLESGRSTEAVVTEVQFDTGLGDDLFTTRYLMRN